ncbi:MAG: polysaccharide deacetylase family protein [Eubacteriales bacterium]
MIIKNIFSKHIPETILLFTIFLSFLLFFSGQSSPAGSITSADGPLKLPIIMYHEIKTYKLGKDVISPYEFESDLKYLKDNGYNTITMSQLIDYVYYGAALPEKPVILSFDDGYLNTYNYAYPLLKKYDMEVVLSIIGKNTDDFTKIPDSNPDYSHATWAQLYDMFYSGCAEIQNHTYNMHSITSKRVGCMQANSESLEEYEKVLTDDILKLQNEVFSITGMLPNTFAYPYGGYNDNTDAILKKIGFKATLTCDYGINLITHDPEILFDLKRICRSHGDTIENILKEALKTIR